MRTARMLLATPGSVREARNIVTVALLDAACTPDTIETARLLVSELATNVICHSSSETMVVEVDVDEPVAHVCVADDDTAALPEPHHLDPHAETGRGLLLVEHLALAWACEPREGQPGKQAWFELICA